MLNADSLLRSKFTGVLLQEKFDKFCGDLLDTSIKNAESLVRLKLLGVTLCGNELLLEALFCESVYLELSSLSLLCTGKLSLGVC